MAKPPSLTPGNLRRAEAEISAVDKTMAKCIAELGPLSAEKREPPFQVLAVSIINQQISQAAADAIESRVAKIVPQPFLPKGFLRASPARLRAAGLSMRKVEYLKELARRADKDIIPVAKLSSMDDEEIIRVLTDAPGIGQWTAEMFLMFALARPDVVSLGDGALRRAAVNLYGKRFRGNEVEVLRKCSEKWRPWRTVGCRYLWRSLRPRKFAAVK